ncbi:MAG: 30S ribosomal protein S4, partial [Bacilli bacterium]|nr:30S ribosomal protein S4 [Bacilli bacterium]
PGQHGSTRRRSQSEYGLQLAEKQKLRFMYGLSERQFSNLFNRASKMPGVTGENFLFLLESRLDNLVYRLGFARTRRQARQLVSHGHILVDGKRVDIPSYIVEVGQTITLTEKARNFQIVKEALEATISRAPYLAYDEDTMTGTYTRLPMRDEILPDIKESLIVEFYSR